MAAFCNLKHPKVNILPFYPAKCITPQVDNRGLVTVCYKRSITLQVLCEASIIISLNMTRQNQKFISVSVLDADLNLLHLFGREARKSKNVKSIVALVFLWCFRLLNGFLKSSWRPLITLHLMYNCLNCLIWSKSDYCTVI